MKFWEALKSKITPQRFREDHDGWKAQAEARNELAANMRRTKEVDRVTDSLRNLRERNHFGEAVEAAMARRSRS